MAKDTADQNIEWVTAHLLAMADSAAQEGKVDQFVKISRELRQLRPKPVAGVGQDMDAAAKELLDAFG